MRPVTATDCMTTGAGRSLSPSMARPLLADRSGVLVWPHRRTLIVADLHFEKGSAFAARGVPLPPYDTAATVERLAQSIDRHRPERVLCLGDSFHDGEAPRRVAAATLERIRSLVADHDWIWIAGNHDPAPDPLWGGRSVDEIVIESLVFRHQAAPGADAGEISGHYHPKARVRLRGRTVSSACFVTDGNRLVMPAFGSFTGGLDVTSPAIQELFPHRFEVLFPGPEKLHRFPLTALVRSRRITDPTSR